MPYEKIDEMIRKNLENRVGLETIKEKYRSGISMENIAFMLRLSKQEIDWVMRNIITREDKNQRDKNIAKFESLNFRIDIRDHSDRKDVIYGKNRKKEEDEHEL